MVRAKAIAAAALMGLGLLGWVILSGRPQDGTVPRFELTNWDGQRVSTDSLKGERTILVFTYAKCVFGCPLITHQLKSLDEEIGSPPDLNFLHISVNPTLDTPQEILKHFDKHEIDAKQDSRWLFLAGEEEEVASVLADYGIEVKRTPVKGGVLVEHTIKVLVINRAGEPVATFDTYHWDTERMLHALRS